MLNETLGPLAGSIHVADVGAAHFGEVQPYQSLLDAELAVLSAFEPDRREAVALQERLGPRATLHHVALGDGDEHTLYLCQPGLGMTSLFEPDPETLGFFNLFPEWGRVVGTEPCQTHRLDDIGLDGVDLLKMDVQGSELSILRHGRSVLAESVAVQCEISFITLYRNQPTFGEIDAELRAQGMIPHRFTDVKRWSIHPTIRDGNPRVPFNQLLEADIVYICDLIHPGDLSDARIAKLGLVAHHCYDSPDLTARCLEELERRGSVPRATRDAYYASLSPA